MSANQIKVTLVRSVIGSNEKVCATVRGLGLRKTNSSRVLENSPN
ncbi:MAG: 50S ribosomal protein L30, partial [SAR324 cluster bacterium]|nr:50S ribosomal protein L30 [SAR324 cluster bacterium]